MPQTLKQAKTDCQAEANENWQAITPRLQGQFVEGAENEKWLLIKSGAGKLRGENALQRKIDKGAA